MNKEMSLCKCGCGERVTKKNNKYIWGHNRRDFIITEEMRQKASIRMKGKTYIELYGEEKAKRIKEKIGIKSKEDRFRPTKDKTWNEVYGIEKADEMRKNLIEKNTGNPKLKDRCGIKNPAYKGAKDSLYDHWSPKLTFDENKKNDEEKIEVRCIYCGKWFTPTSIEMDNRIGALKGCGVGGSFYCSKSCKELCPDYYQVLWPKNYKPYENNPFRTRTEVSSELRKIVFERDNWLCQKCESITNTQLECHHIDPVSQAPMFANDQDSCITLCKDCHKEIHMKIEGCKYSELRCKNEN